VPFELRLPDRLRKAHWKVKIREKESREPPHVTIIRRTDAWRIDLRSGEFMDTKPDPAEVPEELVCLIETPENWQRLCDAWNEKYPANPVEQDDLEQE
jgi:hypothetical protein